MVSVSLRRPWRRSGCMSPPKLIKPEGKAHFRLKQNTETTKIELRALIETRFYDTYKLN